MFAVMHIHICVLKLERQDLSRTYLAHHELESVFIDIIIVFEGGSPEGLPQVCHELEVWVPAFWKLDSPPSLNLIHKSLR